MLFTRNLSTLACTDSFIYDNGIFVVVKIYVGAYFIYQTFLKNLPNFNNCIFLKVPVKIVLDGSDQDKNYVSCWTQVTKLGEI